MKVKQIYDRDTGNTYQIGGGSEMKLVAEGVFEYDDNKEIYKNVYSFEPDKTYLFKMYDGDVSFFSTTIFATGDVIVSTPQAELYESGAIIMFKQVNENDIYFVETNTGESVFGLYASYIYKIYELPFTLPNS